MPQRPFQKKQKVKAVPLVKSPDSQDAKQPEPLSSDLAENIAYLQSQLVCDDLKKRTFTFGDESLQKGCLFYLDGMVNNKMITEGILNPLLLHQFQTEFDESPDKIDEISKSIICVGELKKSSDMSEMILACLSGDTILFLQGCSSGLIVGTKGWEKRAVSEPESEQVIRGPREGFTEAMVTNLALLRRRIKDRKLRIEYLTLGERTVTNVSIVYLEGIANPKVVKKLKERLQSFHVDSILDSGYIEEYIEDAPYSIFSTVGYTEKPDVVAGKVLEGRIGIFVDGSPIVLTVPLLFIESFQTAEDYYIRPLFASLARANRFAAYFIALFSVPIFIAMTTFHQELIPTTLLFTIARAKEGTPFPTFVEAVIMVYSFELLREAGLRLPRPVGQAISIVGALIVGDAAVAAGLVGAPMVIAVAIGSVSGFVVPTQVDSISTLRLMFMVLATFFGGFGIALGFLAVLVHLANLSSFGVPYFDSLEPSRDLQDSFIRAPLRNMVYRPKSLSKGNTRRRGTQNDSAQESANQNSSEEAL